jgi:hypothetical protein
MTKTQPAKVVVFGDWLEKKKDGTVQPTQEGNLIQEWLRGKSIDELGLWADVSEFEKLLRKEFDAERHYRDLLVTDLALLRNQMLDNANAKVPDLSNPGSTIVEAYNNGVEMGRHWRPIEIAQKLSDIIDKMAIEQLIEQGQND